MRNAIKDIQLIGLVEPPELTFPATLTRGILRPVAREAVAPFREAPRTERLSERQVQRAIQRGMTTAKIT